MDAALHDYLRLDLGRLYRKLKAVADHIGNAFARGPFYLPGQSHGYGLLGAVRTDGPRAPAPLNAMDGSVGEFYWAGYAGTYFWVDPKEQLVGVYMMQSVKQLLPVATTFKTLVLQSIVE